jgi:pimeloyl-ACP methyl ester carboxylesterase
MKKLYKILKVSAYVIGSLVIVVSMLFGYQDIPLDDLKEKYAKYPSTFTSIDGMEVHFREEGDLAVSIPIVLIHGTGSSLHTFDDWSDNLKHKYRIVRMDLPGYGLTDPFPDSDYSIDNYVHFVKQFLDERGIEKCIIGGNSLGGHIAWQFTAEHTERVQKLILIDASGYPNKAKSVPLAFKIAKIPILKNLFMFITPKFIARSSVENVYYDKSKVTDELANRYFELTLRKGNRRAFIERLAVNNSSESYKRIRSIKQPTLVLWGDQDLLIPVENAERFHQDLPNNTLVIMKDAGHIPMEELPLQSLSVVESFLDQNND